VGIWHAPLFNAAATRAVNSAEFRKWIPGGATRDLCRNETAPIHDEIVCSLID